MHTEASQGEMPMSHTAARRTLTGVGDYVPHREFFKHPQGFKGTEWGATFFTFFFFFFFLFCAPPVGRNYFKT